MSVRRSLFVMALLTALLPIFLFGGLGGRANRSAVPTDVQLYQVGRGDVTLSVSAIGLLSAERVNSLSFLTAGRVLEVRVQRDDYVLEGDILARLDDTAARLSYEQALLGVERAELDLQDLLEPDETQIRLAEAALASARGAYLSVVTAVSSDQISAAQLAYEQALNTFNVLQDYVDSGLPPDQYEMARARAGEAFVNAQIAGLQLEQLRNSTNPQAGAAAARVRQAEQELERVKAGPTQAQRDAAQQAIRRAENQLERARVAYERTVLRAPFDGVISQLNVEVGTLVGPGLPAIEITDVEPLELTVQVDEVDVGRIREGMEVRVELDALPDVILPARLTRIAQTGNASGGIVTYDVDIELQGQDERARVGMTAEATIILQEKRNVLVVPNSYIRLDRRMGRAFVNVLRPDDRIEEVEVTLGLQGQEDSEILSGLQEGDLIAINLSGGGLNQIIGG